MMSTVSIGHLDESACQIQKKTNRPMAASITKLLRDVSACHDHTHVDAGVGHQISEHEPDHGAVALPNMTPQPNMAAYMQRSNSRSMLICTSSRPCRRRAGRR